jgi:hypothetical protein
VGGAGILYRNAIGLERAFSSYFVINSRIVSAKFLQEFAFAPAAPDTVRTRTGVRGCGDMSHG